MALSIVVAASRGKRFASALVRSLEEAIPEKLFTAVQLLLIGTPPAGVSSKHPLLRVETHFVEKKHPGIRRNVGFLRADYEVVALLDDDVRVTPSWFEAIHEEYCNNGYRDLLTGPSDLPYNQDFSERLAVALTNHLFSPFRSSHRTTILKEVSYKNVEFCNCVLTKSTWAALGRFDEIGDWRIDDSLFCHKAKVLKVGMTNHPGLKVAHLRSNFPFGYYRWVWCEKFHQAKVFVHYLFVWGVDPYFMSLFFLTAIAALLTVFFSLKWLIPALAIFLAAAYPLSMKTHHVRSPLIVLLTPPLLLCSYLATVGGFYLGLIYGVWTKKPAKRVVRTIRVEMARIEEQNAA